MGMGFKAQKRLKTIECWVLIGMYLDKIYVVNKYSLKRYVPKYPILVLKTDKWVDIDPEVLNNLSKLRYIAGHDRPHKEIKLTKQGKKIAKRIFSRLKAVA